MRTNLRRLFVAFPVKNDQIGILLWHVAINAVTGGLVIHLGEGIGSRFVAAQAMLGEGCEIVLGSVDVVASNTGHG